MNLAKIKRKKIPVQAGRGNTLPPLDIIAEREKSAPVQALDYVSAKDQKEASEHGKSMTNKTMLSSKLITNPASKQSPKALSTDLVKESHDVKDQKDQRTYA